MSELPGKGCSSAFLWRRHYIYFIKNEIIRKGGVNEKAVGSKRQMLTKGLIGKL